MGGEDTGMRRYGILTGAAFVCALFLMAGFPAAGNAAQGVLPASADPYAPLDASQEAEVAMILSGRVRPASLMPAEAMSPAERKTSDFGKPRATHVHGGVDFLFEKNECATAEDDGYVSDIRGWEEGGSSGARAGLRMEVHYTGDALRGHRRLFMHVGRIAEPFLQMCSDGHVRRFPHGARIPFKKGQTLFMGGVRGDPGAGNSTGRCMHVEAWDSRGKKFSILRYAQAEWQISKQTDQWLVGGPDSFNVTPYRLASVLIVMQDNYAGIRKMFADASPGLERAAVELCRRRADFRQLLTDAGLGQYAGK